MLKQSAEDSLMVIEKMKHMNVTPDAITTTIQFHWASALVGIVVHLKILSPQFKFSRKYDALTSISGLSHFCPCPSDRTLSTRQLHAYVQVGYQSTISWICIMQCILCIASCSFWPIKNNATWFLKDKMHLVAFV